MNISNSSNRQTCQIFPSQFAAYYGETSAKSDTLLVMATRPNKGSYVVSEKPPCLLIPKNA